MIVEVGQGKFDEEGCEEGRQRANLRSKFAAAAAVPLTGAAGSHALYAGSPTGAGSAGTTLLGFSAAICQ